jgi:2-dehydropantoate 2-reductase
MRFIVYGAGAVGGVVAARLHLGGVDVQVVARGPHLEAIRDHGLRLVTPHGEDVVPIGAAASLGDLDRASDTVVLVTVKSHQTAAVMRDVALHTSPDVTLVSGQNGVANEQTLQRTRRHVLGMCVMLPSSTWSRAWSSRRAATCRDCWTSGASPPAPTTGPSVWPRG